MSIEHADFDGIERLAFVLGGEIVSTFDHPELVKLGSCKLIEEVLIGDEKLLKFSGTAIGPVLFDVCQKHTEPTILWSDESELGL